MATVLQDAAGEVQTFQEGESCNVHLTFHSIDGVQLIKSDFVTLTLTLFDEATNAIINGWDALSVIDANHGTMDDDGNLTMRFNPDDLQIVGDIAIGNVERHVLQFRWTWNDGVEDRVGKPESLIMQVERLADPT